MAVLQIRVTLDEVEPEIWRVVEIGGDRTLTELHDALQIAMGWTDSHLHLFEHPDGRCWTNLAHNPESDDDDERLVTVAEALDAGHLMYDYDFGDSWRHRLDLVQSIPGDGTRVVLVAGARSAPPEDCGGVPGYEELLKTLADPSAEDHDAVTVWASDSRSPWAESKPFDPDALDVDAVNRRLQRRFERETGTRSWGHELRAVADRLTPGAHTAFGDHLESADLDHPVVVDLVTATASVREFSWLLHRVAGGGLTLTSTGRLPPAVVREASTALGWDQRWIGAMNREDHVPPAADLREWATKTGLVRRYRGTLLPTRAGVAVRHDPVLLLRHLSARATGLTAKGAGHDAAVLLFVELAAGVEPHRDVLAERVASGLHLIGYAGEDRWSAPSSAAAWGVLLPTWSLLGMLGLVDNHSRELVPDAPGLVRDVARLALTEV